MFGSPAGILVLLAATLFIAALVALGLAAGYWFGMNATAKLAALAIKESEERLKRYQAISGGLVEKSRTVTNLASDGSLSLPPALVRAIEELAAAAKQLRLQLEQNGLQQATNSVNTVSQEATPRFQPIKSPAQQDRRDDSPPKLTGDEIQCLTALAGTPSECSPDEAKKRYDYDCLQMIYPGGDSDGDTWNERGMEVRCHDIGPQGISFFLNKRPDFGRLVVSLGTAEAPLLMMAEVMYSKAVYIHNDARYLVGCRFTGRVEQSSDLNWSSKQKQLETVQIGDLASTAS